MTMTLEELRESLDVGCLPNTDRPRWFVAIDAAIRERDELRTAYTSASQSRDYWKECAGRVSSELETLKARMFQGIVLDVDDLARGHAGLPSEWRGKRVLLVVEE